MLKEGRWNIMRLIKMTNSTFSNHSRHCSYKFLISLDGQWSNYVFPPLTKIFQTFSFFISVKITNILRSSSLKCKSTFHKGSGTTIFLTIRIFRSVVLFPIINTLFIFCFQLLIREITNCKL